MEPKPVDVSAVIKKLEGKLGELMTTISAQEVHIEQLMEQLTEKTETDAATNGQAAEQLTLEGID